MIICLPWQQGLQCFHSLIHEHVSYIATTKQNIYSHDFNFYKRLRNQLFTNGSLFKTQLCYIKPIPCHKGILLIFIQFLNCGFYIPHGSAFNIV